MHTHSTSLSEEAPGLAGLAGYKEPWVSYPAPCQLGVLAHACHPSTQEGEAKGSQIQDHPELYSVLGGQPALNETCLKKKKNEKNVFRILEGLQSNNVNLRQAANSQELSWRWM